MYIAIEPATTDEIPIIVKFIGAARASMFPMIDADAQIQDEKRELAEFQQSFLDDPEGAFFTARVNGRLIATIGYLAYNHRFPHLKLEQHGVVEITRLYVEPTYRRNGLATKLVAAVENKARMAGVERLYLHTHPFLPGAVSFWEQQRFSIMHVEDDPVWQTIHMSQRLAE